MFDSAEKLEARGADRDAAIERFAEMRRESEALTANLTPEDQSIQSMPDVSPTKWHLAHTTWFFETFILTRLDPSYRVFDPAFAYLFNSYYRRLAHGTRDLSAGCCHVQLSMSSPPIATTSARQSPGLWRRRLPKPGGLLHLWSSWGFSTSNSIRS